MVVSSRLETVLEALGMLRGEGADLVVTDWNLPGMDGLILANEIRRNVTLEQTLILMVTTRSVKDDIMEARQAGVNDYIIKPFSPKTRGEKIEKVPGCG